ncbi:MAG: SprT family zinc-dependent metalloprotease [Alysiella sp.]|uniref:M48 family metallopeptidase n=1 Tax=Alysiella sp. TaxID=1872483 RepID=UPI0026DC1029|nr:SprT family zinc-dependent metalloprotease [Alysiella sp.]MDO4434228.1 SprT family zinc-dependent metalloprotease [Alysiella sp.]
MGIVLYHIGEKIIVLHMTRRTKKNIILRPRDAGSIYVGVPAWLGQRDLLNWLDKHQNIVLSVLNRSPMFSQNTNQLPERIWFLGEPCVVEQAAITQLDFAPQEKHIRLPENWDYVRQNTVLRQELFQAAKVHLLPKLANHTVHLNLKPVGMALSRAKTFWGVCRSRTGIRLNWRLIGAPNWVQDYVCIHELCHLLHPNHSPAFWAVVNQATPHTQAAKNWLKAYGKELFVLG